MADFGKLSLIHGGLAFELHLASLTLFSHSINSNNIPGLPDLVSRDNAIAAFTIIAYLLFLGAFILLMLMNFGELKGNKIVLIVTMVVLFVAVASEIVALAIYGDTYAIKLNGFVQPYVTAAFVVGAASGLVAAICLVLQMCGK